MSVAIEKINARTTWSIDDLSNATRHIIAQNKDIFDHATSPLEKMSVIEQSVMLDLGAITAIVNPAVAKVLDTYLRSTSEPGNEETAEASDALGIGILTALKSMMIGYTDPETLVKMNMPLSLLNIYFTVEKFSDDFGTVDPVTGQLLYPHVVNAFEKASLMIINGEIELEAALQMMITEIGSTAHIQTEASEKVSGMLASVDPSVVAMLDEHAPGFSTDPNMYFLVMNLVALYLLQKAFKEIRNKPENIRLQYISQAAVDGLFSRYVATGLIFAKQNMPIEEAIEVGKYSILTDTFAGLFAMAADADASIEQVIRLQIEMNQRLIGDTIDEASYLIRMLNDGGAAIESPKNALADIALLRERFEMELTPRELFAKLGAITAADLDSEHPEKWKDQFSRFIKDTIEQEYSMILNSGMEIGNIAQNWRQFAYNLEFVATQYVSHRERFKSLITRLNQVAPYAAEFLGRFVLFNRELYSLFGGDYDRSRAILSKLKSMIDHTPYSWQIEYIIEGEEDLVSEI